MVEDTITSGLVGLLVKEIIFSLVKHIIRGACNDRNEFYDQKVKFKVSSKP